GGGAGSLGRCGSDAVAGFGCSRSVGDAGPVAGRGEGRRARCKGEDARTHSEGLRTYGASCLFGDKLSAQSVWVEHAALVANGKVYLRPGAQGRALRPI